MSLAPDEANGTRLSPRLRRLAPFAAVAALAFVLAPLPPEPFSAGVGLALGLTLVIGLALVIVPWQRLPPAAAATPAFAYLVVIAVLRESEGGAASAVSPLVLLPIFWLALYGTRGQLRLLLVAVAALFVVPIVAIGAPRYPVSEWERAGLWALSGAIVGFTVQDLVRRIREQAEALRALSRTDPLTGICNRRAWESGLADHLEQARRSGRPLCVALLDLDRFKSFNDRHGHVAGDDLLREVAERWGREVRAVDTLARYGGEEFGIVLVDADARAAFETVERVRRRTPRGQTASAGVAAWDGRESAEDLVARADAALYEAKQRGRDRTAVSDSAASPRSGGLDLTAGG